MGMLDFLAWGTWQGIELVAYWGGTMSLVCPACEEGMLSPMATMDAWLEVARTAADDRAPIARAVDTDARLRAERFDRCDACKHVALMPVPSVEALTVFYQQYFANANYSAKAEKKVRRAQKRIAGLAKRVKGRRFLDVGCNVGCAVEAARLSGFEATGIEIDAESVETAARLYHENRFVQSTVEAFAEQGEQFDLIYTTEVIEHVPDIDAFARALAALTAPGGLVFLTTPDVGHWRRPKAFLQWAEVKPPEHVSWFSQPSIKALFLRAGFSRVGFRLCMKPGIRMVAER